MTLECLTSQPVQSDTISHSRILCLMTSLLAFLSGPSPVSVCSDVTVPLPFSKFTSDSSTAVVVVDFGSVVMAPIGIASPDISEGFDAFSY